MSHTSEQNVLIEKKHRHLVDTGLTLLAQASLLLKFWPDSSNTVVHLINRLHTKVLKGIIPLGRLYGIKPDHQNLRTFGCLCFLCI